MGASVRHAETTGQWNAMQLAARNGHTVCLERLHANGGRLRTLRRIHPGCRPVVNRLVAETHAARAEATNQLLTALPMLPHDVVLGIVDFAWDQLPEPSGTGAQLKSMIEIRPSDGTDRRPRKRRRRTYTGAMAPVWVVRLSTTMEMVDDHDQIVWPTTDVLTRTSITDAVTLYQNIAAAHDMDEADLDTLPRAKLIAMVRDAAKSPHLLYHVVKCWRKRLGQVLSTSTFLGWDALQSIADYHIHRRCNGSYYSELSSTLVALVTDSLTFSYTNSTTVLPFTGGEGGTPPIFVAKTTIRAPPPMESNATLMRLILRHTCEHHVQMCGAE